MKDYYEYKFSFTQDDVINFAEASGDKNPIHLNEDYAKKTIFKKRILHGFLAGSVFSKVFGTLHPGPGTIYLKQSMTFYKPMFISENYIAQFIVTQKYPEKKRALVKTNIIDANNQLIIDGEALIQHESIS